MKLLDLLQQKAAYNYLKKDLILLIFKDARLVPALMSPIPL